MTLPTQFAPAERSNASEILRQNEVISRSHLLDVLHGIPQLIAILNANRQIVHSNRAFLSLLGFKNMEGLLGLRPGEALQCVCSTAEGGCGTSEACHLCGATEVILLSQKNGEMVTRECRIRTSGEREPQNLELSVTAAPLVVEGESFTIFSAIDISDRARRKVLERIFLRDALITAGTIEVMARDFGEPGHSPDYLRENASHLEKHARRLVEEIAGQRLLARAEEGVLKLEKRSVSVRRLIEETEDRFKAHPVSSGRFFRVAPPEGDFMIRTDRSIFLYSLGIFIRNAFEAALAGETVSLAAFRSEKSVLFEIHNPGFMHKDVQLRIFQKSFTTKGPGRGLGVYSARLFIERYLGGGVSFESSIEKGTIFRTGFPL